jgi:16S rRNA (adenine1518-N6/adenine1519-N6)-dimethyltransferase
MSAEPVTLKDMSSVRKPKLGQNFLVDDEARHRIADALGDVSDRTVIEIGPGHGAITEILASRCRRLIALEFDPALVRELAFRFRDQPHVRIIETDVLKADLTEFAEAGETVDVIGNLPYYITSDILLHLFAAAPVLRRGVLMMQREVAERVAASPGVRDYGALSALTQMYAQVDQLFTLPPAAFSPPPDVFSTVLRLHFRARFEELAVDAAGFDRFLRQSFGQKRKTLNNNLRNVGYEGHRLASCWPSEIPQQSRAEQLSLPQMALLYRSLNPSS